MKKLLALLMALAMVLSLAACGDDNTPATSGDNSNTTTNEDSSSDQNAEASGEDSNEAAALSGTVATGGSTSMQELMEVFIESFNETNPGVNITYEPTGSAAGITGAQDKTLDIGLSSRNLKEEETGVSAITVALDGIAIVVNPANTVEDLTLEQIAAIATGEITNWSEVGGEDGEIVMIGRESSSGTRDGFETIAGVKDSCVYAQELTSTGAVIAAVQSNANAIGYASMAALTDDVKAVTVGGVACTEETVKDGSYTMQRPFIFVLNDDVELSDAVQAFVDFAQSDDAAELIAVAGAVSPN